MSRGLVTLPPLDGSLRYGPKQRVYRTQVYDVQNYIIIKIKKLKKKLTNVKKYCASNDKRDKNRDGSHWRGFRRITKEELVQDVPSVT